MKIKRQTFIQWKGTDVCMDVYCPSCNYHSHFDCDFLYFLKCPKCGDSFEVGDEVKLRLLSAEEVKYYEERIKETSLDYNDFD